MMSDAEEKEGSAPSENSFLEPSLELWFAEALEIFLEGKKPWILDASPTIDNDLHSVLADLWNINFKLCFHERKLKAWGLHIEKKRKLFSVTEFKESVVSSDQLMKETEIFKEYGVKKLKTIRELRLQGKDYPIFWIRRFPWFWTKSYSDELTETVNNYVKETEQGEHEDIVTIKNMTVTVQKEIVFCQKVAANFIEDLEKVKEMVAHDLGGVRYYFLRIAEITVPILVLLTFVFAVLRVFKKI